MSKTDLPEHESLPGDSPANPPGARLMQYVPTYHCPNPVCDAPIGAHRVVITRGKHAWQRTVKVHCEACDQVHAVDQVAVDGFWRNAREVERVTAPKAVAGVKRAADKADGTLQRMAS